MPSCIWAINRRGQGDGPEGCQNAGRSPTCRSGRPTPYKNEGRQPARMRISVAPAGLEQMSFEFGVPLAEGPTTALLPTKEEIEKLLAVAPRYGIEIRVPGH